MMKLSGSKLSLSDSLTASLIDRVSILVWQNTEDGHNGTNMPESVFSMMAEKEETGFDSIEAFERVRQEFLD